MIDDKSCPQTNVTQNVLQAHCHTAVSRDGGRRATKKVKGRERKIQDDPNCPFAACEMSFRPD